MKTNNIRETRDPFIIKSYKREINLQTKVEKDKTKYSRKSKHKDNYVST